MSALDVPSPGPDVGLYCLIGGTAVGMRYSHLSVSVRFFGKYVYSGIVFMLCLYALRCFDRL
ncbi:hypothetical protein BDV30DRAFT_202261 [Aspergillus minisclerotigenes]|uniref:Uncharacterized protein n=1 Tax=Aspergillus minisclerotigenes TaxID=656917 RepID=A0A5N6JJM6_9EURO|nr:hypothetical protein BDV30DRAFT_202261 [Aspergillus minisclerotigenes]